MAYQANPMQDEYIRKRIRDILHEKIQDRTYNLGGEFVGGAMVGGQYVGGRRRRRSYRSRRSYGSALEDYMGGYAKGYRKSEKNPVKVAAGRASAKCNPWIVFYREWSRANAKAIKGTPVAERAAAAAEAYRKFKRH